jgi:acyl-CoA synthetase (NDP forming)
MDVNEVDGLSYLVEDPETRVIGIHLESIGGEGREFLRLIRKASTQGKFHDPASIYQTVLDAMIAEPNVDALAIQIHPQALVLPKEFMGIFCRAARAGKPIVLWLAGMESGRHENLMWLEEQGVPVFPSPEKAVHALAALHRLSRHSIS